MQRKFLLIPIAAIMLGAIGASTWYFSNHGTISADALTLYGNVDIRQVQLAFNGSERIATMQAREGDPVKKGQLLAALDTTRLQSNVTLQQAQLSSQQQVVARMEAGSRPEEISKAQADVEAARITADNARKNYQRLRELVSKNFVAQQQADDALAAADAAQARYQALQETLQLVRMGPRKEDIAAAKAMLKASRPVYTLVLTDPVWVRTYVQGTDLGKVRPGMRADVSTDSFAGKNYRARVGYISPTAEFTPKAVETTEVRSSLVYQVRIFVCNPQGELRQGMPATVTIKLGQPAAQDAYHCQD